jgi:predicted GNAT family acetyltransferase
MDADNWATYVATLDGTPAATAAALTSGDHVGLLNIVTDPAHRGRGLAAAITSAAVQSAFERGTARAFLQASRSGYPTYQRIGFREVEQWHIWIA